MHNRGVFYFWPELLTPEPDWHLLGVFADWCEENDFEQVPALRWLLERRRWPDECRVRGDVVSWDWWNEEAFSGLDEGDMSEADRALRRRCRVPAEYFVGGTNYVETPSVLAALWWLVESHAALAARGHPGKRFDRT